MALYHTTRLLCGPAATEVLAGQKLRTHWVEGATPSNADWLLQRPPDFAVVVGRNSMFDETFDEQPERCQWRKPLSMTAL